MSARTTQNVVQAASKALKVHHASVKSGRPKPSELGREIFVYNHLQTNQVVYSLTRSLKNNHALKQLPYNGKKTVPASLRKDLWSPLACISITDASPSAPQYGLRILHKLREYRKLHETQWPAALAQDDQGRPLSRRLRGRKLCDQKANSVADMAAALTAVTIEEGAPKVRAMVRWGDVLDAEFAESWPETVVHDRWVVGRNNRTVRWVEERREEGPVEVERAKEEGKGEKEVVA